MLIRSEVTYDYYAHISSVGTEEDPLLEQFTPVLLVTLGEDGRPELSESERRELRTLLDGEGEAKGP